MLSIRNTDKHPILNLFFSAFQVLNIYCNVKIHVIKYTFLKQGNDLCLCGKPLSIQICMNNVFQVRYTYIRFVANRTHFMDGSVATVKTNNKYAQNYAKSLLIAYHQAFILLH